MTTPFRIATIDVGTNTALLLIAEETAGGTLKTLYEERHFVRLGQGVDETRRIHPDALDRLLAALAHYQKIVAQFDHPPVVIGATSASRDAENLDEVIARVHAQTGWRYEVLLGEEEAQWSFRGTVSGQPNLDACTVLDIGGGSTEIILGSAKTGRITFRQSLDMGSVRITERFFKNLPPTSAEIQNTEGFIKKLLAPINPEIFQEIPCLGAAGTAVALGLVHSGRAMWDERAERALPTTTVANWSKRLLGLSAADVLALHPSALRGRADVFAAGILIMAEVMHHLGAPTLHISNRGLRHGLALRAWHAHRGGAF